VALLAKDGRSLTDASLEELRVISPLFEEDYYPVVDIERVVAGKVSPGGTAPQRVAEQLVLARRVVERVGR
jgi:argininosuccinate lyase